MDKLLLEKDPWLVATRDGYIVQILYVRLYLYLLLLKKINLYLLLGELKKRVFLHSENSVMPQVHK